MTQIHVMWLLQHHGEMSMGRLAELLDVSVSNATGLIDRMEERGLIERVRVPDDRRVVLVRSPEGGQTVLERPETCKRGPHPAILARLDTERSIA